MKLMRILILSMIFLLSSVGPVLAVEEHEETAAGFMEKEIDGYRVKLTFAEGDAKIGHNKLHVQVYDPQGQPVTNASISIIAELYKNPPASNGAGMEGMNMGDMDHTEKPIQTTKVHLTAVPDTSEFEGEVELSEAGYWMLNVVVGLQPQIKSVMFPVDLVKSGPDWFVLSAFFGLIAAIIVIGGITKRRATNHVPLPEVAA